MSLRAAIGVIRRLSDSGVLPKYAVAGAVAATFYLEPTSTFDLDILVPIGALRSPGSTLLTLDRIRDALTELGYTEFRNEGIIVEGWPVQFLPAERPLEIEALDRAIEMDIASDRPPATARVLRAEYIMAIALSVGRDKDRLRILQFIHEMAFDRFVLREILERNDLRNKWLAFCRQTGIQDRSIIELAP